MIVFLHRSINGLRDIILSIYGSLHYGLVGLIILLKEQDHRYLQSTPKSRLTYSTIRLGLSNPIDWGNFRRFNRTIEWTKNKSKIQDSCLGMEVNWGFLPGLTSSTNPHSVCSITPSAILTLPQGMMVYPVVFWFLFFLFGFSFFSFVLFLF